MACGRCWYVWCNSRGTYLFSSICITASASFVYRFIFYGSYPSMEDFIGFIVPSGFSNSVNAFHCLTPSMFLCLLRLIVLKRFNLYLPLTLDWILCRWFWVLRWSLEITSPVWRRRYVFYCCVDLIFSLARFLHLLFIIFYSLIFSLLHALN